MSFRGENLSELTDLCNFELEKFKCWTISNRLTVNRDRTVFNIVSNLNVQRDNVCICFDREQLNCVTNVKYLGVILDDTLKFNDHIRYVVSKISKAAGILSRLKTLIPLSALKSLYYSLVHPYLNYCNLIWGAASNIHINPLFLLQKRILRIMFNRPFLDHTNALFFESGILKVMDIYKYNLSNFMFLNQHDQIFQNISNYNTRRRNLLIPQFERLTSTQRSINFRGPHAWNRLPVHIRETESLGSFRGSVKEYFLNSYRA